MFRLPPSLALSSSRLTPPAVDAASRTACRMREAPTRPAVRECLQHCSSLPALRHGPSRSRRSALAGCCHVSIVWGQVGELRLGVLVYGHIGSCPPSFVHSLSIFSLIIPTVHSFPSPSPPRHGPSGGLSGPAVDIHSSAHRYPDTRESLSPPGMCPRIPRTSSSHSPSPTSRISPGATDVAPAPMGHLGAHTARCDGRAPTPSDGHRRSGLPPHSLLFNAPCCLLAASRRARVRCDRCLWCGGLRWLCG